jgi:hypothetical protein
MSDFIDTFLHADDTAPAPVEYDPISGRRIFKGMVVRARAKTLTELEDRERASIARLNDPDYIPLPIPFWDAATGHLEPFDLASLKVLERLGMTALEYEILLLEDQLERTRK